MARDDDFIRWLASRAGQDVVARLLRASAAMRKRLFRQQLAFLTDVARYKSLLCPRRAGKSFAAAIYCLDVACRVPGSLSVFMTLTRMRAKQILWRVLKKLNTDFELGCDFNETELTATLANGSVVRLAGCETPADIDKFRGEAYHLFIIDEAKSFSAALLDELLEEAVEPALSDYRGTLILMGTPGPVLDGAFYDATGPDPARRGRWHFHRWNTSDNVAMPHLWADALALKQQKQWTDGNPKWLREYIGTWIADHSELVYKFDAAKNLWKPEPSERNPFGLPPEHAWHYLLGVDLGYRDAFALQVVAYSETHPHFYQVYEYTLPGLHLTPIVEAIKAAEKLCGGFTYAVGDYAGGGAAKVLYETIAAEHGISIEPAQKLGKVEHIDLVNDDLIEGRCKLLEHSALVREMKTLAWETDRKSGLPNRMKEKEGLPNDNCDAFLYTRWLAQHHFWQRPVTRVLRGTPEYIDQAELAAERLAEEKERQRLELDSMGGENADSTEEWLSW